MLSAGRSWQLARERWQLPRRGAVMGILNVTPDSFSDGGRHAGPEAAVEHALHMVQAGADIVDIGGESTRPGAAEVEETVEIQRVLPVVEALRAAMPDVRISVDTRHVAVARAALQAGADVVNDISGLADPAMRELCAEFACGVVLMHMQGTPQTMQQAPHYENVVAEVRAFFEERMTLALDAGIAPECICLDPGIGFGKTTAHNLALIRHLESLRVQNRPLLMALSRKRFLGELWGDAAFGRQSALPTVVMSLMAARYGADLHRVHDVEELSRSLVLSDSVSLSNNWL